MPRQMLTDEHWSKLRPILLQQDIYAKIDLRTTVVGILYLMRTGCQRLGSARGIWPLEYVYKRFNAWLAAGKLLAFRALLDAPDIEWLFLRQGAAGLHWGCHRRGRSYWQTSCGQHSKIHLAVDAYGLPHAFRKTGGEEHDSTEAQALIDALPTGEALIADKGDDSESIREQIEAKGMRPVIPRKRTSKKVNNNLDRWLDRYLHLVKNEFAR